MYPYPVNSSGRKTANAQIAVLRSFLTGIDLKAPASGSANLTIYDSNNSTLTNKTILSEIQVDAGLASCNHEFSNPIQANQGIYAVLTDASGTSAFVIRYVLT